MLWGYANNLFPIQDAKIFFGPVAAIGSLGTIVGGMVTSYCATHFGTMPTLMMGTVGLLFSLFLFEKTDRLNVEKEDIKNYNSPLQSISGIKLYVFYILAIISLSQFCVNILTLQFNLHLQSTITDLNQQSSYLAEAFSWMNTVSFIFKLAVMPFLLRFLPNQTIHFLIPLTYIGVIFGGVGLGGVPVAFEAFAITFITIKGLDYSCFAVAKELLYYALTPTQKYGAKYITDMFFYRTSKAIISIFLIYYQDVEGLTKINYAILIVWFFILFGLFHEEKRVLTLKKK